MTPLRRAAAAVILVVVGLGTAPILPSVTLGADPAASPDGPIHGWPGARSYNNPAGRYSWTVGVPAWMHNVSVDGSAPIEITFGILEAPYGIPVEDIAQAGADLGDPRSERPERVADVRLQAWALDVDGTTVVVIVKSFPETFPALLAEAEAVVESIVVEPAAPGARRRLVFDLPAGWDNG